MTLQEIEPVLFNPEFVKGQGEPADTPCFSMGTMKESNRRVFSVGRVDAGAGAACDILLIMLDGVLRFTEDGVPVEPVGGEYYIQRKGLLQDGPEASDRPSYFYVHFTDGECLPIRALRACIILSMGWSKPVFSSCKSLTASTEAKGGALCRMKKKSSFCQ